MKVLNIHERKFSASPEKVGALIDSLSSREDTLWPKQAWPRMEFARTLSVGAVGGHGPIRYYVEAYTPGKSIRFRFTRPRGFSGYHGYGVLDCGRRVQHAGFQPVSKCLAISARNGLQMSPVRHDLGW